MLLNFTPAMQSKYTVGAQTDSQAVHVHVRFPDCTQLLPWQRTPVVLRLLLINTTETVLLYIPIQYLQLNSKRQTSPGGFAAQVATLLQATYVEVLEARGTQTSLFCTGDDSQSPFTKNETEEGTSTRGQFSSSLHRVILTEFVVPFLPTASDSCYDF